MQVTSQLVATALDEAIPHLACDLRPDVLEGLRRARQDESDERARLVLDQLLENAAVAADDHVPICQDTGTVWICLELGSEGVELATDPFVEADETVARAYRDNALRFSTLRDALTDRSNSGDNTPAFTEIRYVPGSGATLHVMLKGGGSDNASCVEMLAPGAGADGVREVVLRRVEEKASSACPPLVVGVGVGSTFDAVAGLAKHALLRPVDEPAADPQVAAFEADLLTDINALGIGPAALGGDTTALACHIQTAPCHIAALPVAVNLGCCALRSISIDLEDFGRTGELPW